LSSRPVSSRPVSGRLVCPPVRCPAGWCPPVRPVTSVSLAEAQGWPWGSRRCGGQPSRLERIELHVVCGVRAARSTARVGLEGGDPAEVVRRRAGERRLRIWPGRARAQAAAAVDR
jgi:hypothetical protein